ncbi:hypothetical protein IPA_00400 [Ignicoccus pacificus DSM 13166]|uniref:AAA+ ATPase domain-containing protein n=1 Tax=Ignicoccus pacificus DSM 13166 TaxID=940294 RepID=A0A977PKF8_9CREN|nr:hypothetical protein IPA_00400 [Ignicoccus pacificus DSM 13166]
MKCGWRKLLITSDPSDLIRLKGKVLYVSNERPEFPWRRLRPSQYRRVLGTEWDSAVFDLASAIPANAFPAVAETVKAGGKIVMMPPSEPLEEVYRRRGGTGLFGRYLERALKLYEERGRCPPWRPPSGLTEEQRRALKKFAGFVIGRGKAFVIIGDRGRGKSALLGAIAAKSVIIHGISRVEVTSPSPEMPSFLKMMESVLRESKERFRIEKAGEEWKVLGPNWRIEWVPPNKAGGKSGIVLVDEAASIGLARVERILKRSWKVVLSTTIHGYEGSGRALTKIMLRKLRDPVVIELKEPVRYPPNDPVERWLYKVFHLKEYDWDPGEPTRVKEIDRRELADPIAMKEIANLLAMAHYRWEPSDIELVLEHPRGKLFVYEGTSGILGVAFTVDEEPPQDPWGEAKGAALSRLLSRVRPVEARRVVRIAIHPDYQGRGYGSELLRNLEHGITGAVFSNHEVLDFWLKNEYKVIYLSPRYNKVTGEKNVAVAKGIGELQEVVDEAHREFLEGMLLSLHVVYRDVDPKKIHKMMKPYDAEIKIPLKCEYLSLFLEGRIEAETAARSLYACLLSKPKLLEEVSEPPLVIGYLLQGKTLWDLAASYEEKPEEVKDKLKKSLRELALRCRETECDPER